MPKIIIIGNSGSGKSTLAKKLCDRKGCSHLDLDTVAWKNVIPPERESIAESLVKINAFITDKSDWVIDGGYADLAEAVLDNESILIYLNPGIAACLDNCKKRPWEPHKYSSIEAQNKNLKMLLDWVQNYEFRQDYFSKQSHEALFNDFMGEKYRCSSNIESEQIEQILSKLEN